MDVIDAAYHTVHDYPGGAAALGPRLGKLGTTLCAEVRPRADRTAKLGLLDAVRIMEMAGDLRVLDAMEARFGRMAIPLPDVDQAGEEVSAAATAVLREMGDYLTRVTDAVADNKVTDRELRDTERELGQLIGRAQHLQAVLAAMNAREHRHDAQAWKVEVTGAGPLRSAT